MDKKGVKRFSVSVSPELLEDFDKLVKSIGYNRSKAIQLAMRNFLTEHRWMRSEKGVGAGALTMIYDHELRGLTETLTDIQHEHRALINSITHVQPGRAKLPRNSRCQRRGKGDSELAQKLMTERGVKQLELATLTF